LSDRQISLSICAGAPAYMKKLYMAQQLAYHFSML
jgi:hypothetical protein